MKIESVVSGCSFTNFIYHFCKKKKKKNEWEKKFELGVQIVVRYFEITQYRDLGKIFV